MSENQEKTTDNRNRVTPTPGIGSIKIDHKTALLIMFKEIKIQLEHFSRELETRKHTTVLEKEL